jgi:hypothetical protein
MSVARILVVACLLVLSSSVVAEVSVDDGLGTSTEPEGVQARASLEADGGAEAGATGNSQEVLVAEPSEYATAFQVGVQDRGNPQYLECGVCVICDASCQCIGTIFRVCFCAFDWGVECQTLGCFGDCS